MLYIKQTSVVKLAIIRKFNRVLSNGQLISLMFNAMSSTETISQPIY
jgi:hypothetical protein